MLWYNILESAPAKLPFFGPSGRSIKGGEAGRDKLSKLPFFPSGRVDKRWKGWPRQALQALLRPPRADIVQALPFADIYIYIYTHIYIYI